MPWPFTGMSAVEFSGAIVVEWKRRQITQASGIEKRASFAVIGGVRFSDATIKSRARTAGLSPVAGSAARLRFRCKSKATERNAIVIEPPFRSETKGAYLCKSESTFDRAPRSHNSH